MPDIPELNKCPRLLRAINIRNIPQTKIDQLLVLLLPQPSNKAITRQLLPQPNSSQSILSKAEIEEAGDGYRGRAELFLLLHEIGTADEADGAFVAEGGEELQHFGGDGLEWWLALFWGGSGRGEGTRRAGVRVLSTSKRQIVFLTGRASRGG